MANLKASRRAKLPKSDFAIKSKAKTADQKKESGNYPIPDRKHAASALSRVAQHGTAAEKKQVRAAVAKKFPGMGKAGGSKKR